MQRHKETSAFNNMQIIRYNLNINAIFLVLLLVSAMQVLTNLQLSDKEDHIIVTCWELLKKQKTARCLHVHS